MAGGKDVADAVAALDAGLARLEATLLDIGSDLTQDDWLELLGRARAWGNRLAAVEDLGLAAVARHEHVWQEDGTLGTVDRGPGRVALDAADLVAPRLGASHHQAQRRVETAVRLTGREPVDVGDGAGSHPTGLDGLHCAMREGRLDSYRASVVADELVEAPADVAEAVVSALEPHLATEPGPALRRRTRRLLGRISPDLVRVRAERSRSETGLRRWAAEPGVDAWYGTFPTERSAAAWAAIDQRARQYVTEGVCETTEYARGRALTDLVVEHADVTVTLVLTRPVESTGGEVLPQPASTAEDPSAAPAPGSWEACSDLTATKVGAGARADDLVLVHGSRPGEPMLVERRWLDRVAADDTTEVVEQPCDPRSGARLDPRDRLARDGYRPGEPLADLVRARDGRCRFPGCSVAARFCDLDHVRPWPGGPTSAANLLCLCRRHHRVKQSPGWRVRLRPDGVAEWTDPTGVATATSPLDALDQLVLRGDSVDSLEAVVAARSRGVTRAPPELPSLLEERIEHRLDEHEVLLRRRRCARDARARADAAHDRYRRRLARFAEDPPY